MFNQNGTFLNTTLDVYANTSIANVTNEARWTFLTVCQVSCNVPAVVGNGFVLCIFLHKPVLITPFNIYLVVLLSANVFYSLTGGPLDIVNNLYDNWILSAEMCSIYLYLTIIFQGYLTMIHVTITLNRMWAIFYPIHYRHHHNKKVAVLISLAAMAFANAIMLPFLLIDEFHYRQSIAEVGCACNFNAQWWHWAILQVQFA